MVRAGFERLCVKVEVLGKELVECLGASVPDTVAQLQRDVDFACNTLPSTVATARRRLDQLATSIAAVATDIGSPSEGSAQPVPDEAQVWVDALTTQCQSARDELALFAPWLQMPVQDEALADFPELAPIPTLHEAAGLASTLLPARSKVRTHSAIRATTWRCLRARIRSLGRYRAV